MADSQMTRRYGYFRCPDCGRQWESSHVYCRQGTNEVLYGQDCQTCKKECMPTRTERIRCSRCHLTECICTDEELKLKRKTDPSKPHQSSLCHKCRAGLPCQGWDHDDDDDDVDDDDGHDDDFEEDWGSLCT